jgi:uncharacterized protein (DUF1697 family)
MIKSKIKMYRFVSLLRGINVGGQKRIGMAALITLYRSLGFENVRTYLQSGNVVFDAVDNDTVGLTNMVEGRIRQVFNLSAAVFLRTPDELHRIIQTNPFLKENAIDRDKLHVTFLSEVPMKKDLGVVFEGMDRFYLNGSEIYLYCPAGYGKTRFSNDYFERNLNLKATTRNWKTVNALWDITRE